MSTNLEVPMFSMHIAPWLKMSTNLEVPMFSMLAIAPWLKMSTNLEVPMFSMHIAPWLRSIEINELLTYFEATERN